MRTDWTRAWVRTCFLVLLLIPSMAAHAQDATRLPVRELFRVGGDAVEAPVSFTHIIDIGIGPRGEIAVLDLRERRVALFDSAGSFLRSLGRAGNGPGEFQMPGRLLVDSLITVFDAMLERSSVFTVNGQHHATNRLPSLATGRLSHVQPSGAGIAGSTVSMYLGTDDPHEGDIAVVFARGSALDTLLAYRGGNLQWKAARAWGAESSPTGELGAWLAVADTIITADGVRGHLQWFSTSGTLRRVRSLNLGITAAAVTDADRQRFLTDIRKTRPSVPADSRINAPSHWSVATSMVRAQDGTLWVRNGYSGPRAALYSEITPAGVLRRWQLPEGFVLLAARGPKLYGYQQTRLDAPVLVVLQRLD